MFQFRYAWWRLCIKCRARISTPAKVGASSIWYGNRLKRFKIQCKNSRTHAHFTQTTLFPGWACPCFLQHLHSTINAKQHLSNNYSLLIFWRRYKAFSALLLDRCVSSSSIWHSHISKNGNYSKNWLLGFPVHSFLRQESSAGYFTRLYPLKLGSSIDNASVLSFLRIRSNEIKDSIMTRIKKQASQNFHNRIIFMDLIKHTFFTVYLLKSFNFSLYTI